MNCICRWHVYDPVKRTVTQEIEEDCPIHGKARWREPWPPKKGPLYVAAIGSLYYGPFYTEPELHRWVEELSGEGQHSALVLHLYDPDKVLQGEGE